jgi:hypothetical protein
MALSIWQKRVRRISGDPVHGVAVQGTMDGPATCNQLGWRFGTWNVGSLSGRSGEVVDELCRRRVDVCAVQDTRWKGEAAKFVGAKGRRYKLWWKGDDRTGGVGVMVKEELMNKVVEVRRKSARVIVKGNDDCEGYGEGDFRVRTATRQDGRGKGPVLR